MADAESGEFWGLFGGYAPLPKRTATDDAQSIDAILPDFLGNKIFAIGICLYLTFTFSL